MANPYACSLSGDRVSNGSECAGIFGIFVMSSASQNSNPISRLEAIAAAIFTSPKELIAAALRAVPPKQFQSDSCTSDRATKPEYRYHRTRNRHSDILSFPLRHLHIVSTKLSITLFRLCHRNPIGLGAGQAKERQHGQTARDHRGLQPCSPDGAWSSLG